MNDLVLKGGRLIDPSQAIDKVMDIAFADGKVSAIGGDLTGKDTRDPGARSSRPA
jgi:dihydroorotase